MNSLRVRLSAFTLVSNFKAMWSGQKENKNMLSSLTASKKSFLGMATASFVGIVAAIPISMALFGSNNNASAIHDKPTNSVVAGAESDYAQFAYAYTQGFLANATANSSNGTASSSIKPTCDDTTAVSATAASRGSDTNDHSMPVGGLGSAPAPAVASNNNSTSPDSWVENVRNSYNSYRSYVHNSSTVHNVNSNNVTGSNNSTSTNVSVEDSLGVLVGVSNESNTVHNQANDSFNNDSYNTTTTTTTTTTNNSHNTTTDSHNNTAVVANSGNTTTVDTDVNTDIDVTDIDVTDIDVTDIDVTDIDVTDNSVEDNSENFIRIEEA